MKIKRLIISEYKNVKNLNLKFKTPLISLLVGRNGLGKSNLIEILALIFRDLERNQNDADFLEWSDKNFEYYINYECQNSELRILCRSGLFRIFRRQKKSKTVFHELSLNEFKSHRLDEYLPKYIIGYYSGENKRIKDIIQVYESEVIKDLKKNVGLEKGFRRLFFSQNHHSQMILTTLMLYKDQANRKEFKTKIEKLVKKYCTFSGIKQLDFEFIKPDYYTRPVNPTAKTPLPKESIELLEDNLLNNAEFPFWGLKGKANSTLTFLYNNSRRNNPFYDDENKIREERIERLLLYEIKPAESAAAVYETFGDPINLFDGLESLMLAGSLKELSLAVHSKKKDISFAFKELSEGEQQLITVLGLVLMIGHEDCLFLLDEPDTHLNPIWQRQYVKLLTEFNLDDKNSHMIVATHSPLIVQAAENADIFLYTDRNGEIEIHENYIGIHNLRIDQILVSEYFNLESSRPPRLDSFFVKRDKILSKKGKLSKSDKKELQELEKKYGGLPSGESLTDIEILKFLHDQKLNLEKK